MIVRPSGAGHMCHDTLHANVTGIQRALTYPCPKQ